MLSILAKKNNRTKKKKTAAILTEIRLNLWTNLGRIYIFTMLNQ